MMSEHQCEPLTIETYLINKGAELKHYIEQSSLHACKDIQMLEEAKLNLIYEIMQEFCGIEFDEAFDLIYEEYKKKDGKEL